MSVANFIKDIILWLDFDKEKFRGHCYDGCSTIMGKNEGVAKQIALSTNCRAHSLHLVCGDWMVTIDVDTCIRSVTEPLRNLKVQSHFSDVFKLTKLVLVLPATMSRVREDSIC